MKKALITLLAICMITSCLIGCTQKSLKNQIAPKELTQDQADIMNLLNSDIEILYFDYKTEEAYKNMDFWVEVYENGVLVDTPAGANLNRDEAGAFNGQLAILITKKFRFQWSFTLSENSIQVSQTGEYSNVNYETLGNAFGPIIEPVKIEDGKEIVLYSAIYSDGGIQVFEDKQIFIEQPELLNEYPYAYIIKGKFEK